MRPPNLALATLCATLLSASSARAQLATAWIVQYGTTNDDYGNGIALDANGDAWIGGNTYGNMGGTGNAGGTDAILSRISPAGAILSTVQRGSNLNEWIASVVLLGNTSIFTAGWSFGGPDGTTNAGSQDTLAFRYTTTGTWQNTIVTGGSARDEFTRLAATSTNVFGVGQTQSSFAGQTNAGDYDAFITKMDATGTPIWTRFLGTPAHDDAVGITVDANGNSYITGTASGALPGGSSHGASDYYVAKYDSDGNRLFTIQRGTSNNDTASGIRVDGSGNIYITGATRGDLDGNSNLGGGDVFLTKLDSAGNLIWTRTFGGSGEEFVDAIDLDGSGNIWIGGGSWGTIGSHLNTGAYDGYVAKFDNAGNLKGTQFFTAGGTDAVYDLVALPDGVEVVGVTQGNLARPFIGGLTDIFVAKIVPEPGVCGLLMGAIGMLGMGRSRGRKG